MPDTLLDVVKAKLETDVVVDNVTWKCFIGYTPDDLDQTISLHRSGGFAQDVHGGENVIETFQARVRAAEYDYLTVHDKWWELFNSLNDADLSADDIFFIQALSSGPAHFMDDKNRHNFTANFRVVRTTPV